MAATYNFPEIEQRDTFQIKNRYIASEFKINSMEEIWLPVVDWEGLYEVSSYGRVRSLDRWTNSKNGSVAFRRGKILSMSPNKGGYNQVKLYDSATGRKNINKRVNRLVAEAFIPNPNNLPQVNHKDENPSNDHVYNLEWCTSQYNMTYNDRHIKAGRKSRKIVYQYDKQLNLIKEWKSGRIAAEEGDFNYRNISKVVRGDKKSHGGFIWSTTKIIKDDDKND